MAGDDRKTIRGAGTAILLPLAPDRARFLQNLLADAKRTVRSHAAMAHVRSHSEAARSLEAYAGEVLDLMALIEQSFLATEEPQVVLITPRRLRELEEKAAHYDALGENKAEAAS